MNNAKQDDAALKAYKEWVRGVVDGLKADLKDWVHRHDGDDMFGDPPGEITSAQNAVEVTSALLETGIDRQIHLHGETDARELVMSAFDRRAKVLRQRLQ